MNEFSLVAQIITVIRVRDRRNRNILKNLKIYENDVIAA